MIVNNLLLTFICSTLIYVVVKASHDSSSSSTQPTYTDKQNEEYKKAYINQLKIKRQAHHEAIQRIVDYQDAKKQRELIDMMLKTLFQTLFKSLETLSKIKETDESKVKLDENIGNSMSAVIENTAFFADLVLHFPNMFKKVFKKHPAWQNIIESAITLTLKTQLIDETTDKAINLMRQELNLIERDPKYVNPYKLNLNEKLYKDEPQPDEITKKKKKEKRKRGPGLSGPRNEL